MIELYEENDINTSEQEVDHNKIKELLEETENKLARSNKEIKKLRILVRKMSDERAERLGLDKDEEYDKLINKAHLELGKTPIREVGLSTKTGNTLYRNGILYIEQLEGIAINEIKDIKNIGSKAVDEILKVTKERGLHIESM